MTRSVNKVLQVQLALTIIDFKAKQIMTKQIMSYKLATVPRLAHCPAFSNHLLQPYSKEAYDRY